MRAPSSSATRSDSRKHEVLAVGVHRPDRVDHPPRREIAGGRRDRLADRQTATEMAGPQLAALLEDRRTAAPVDRPIHPSPAQQRGVGGVHDRVDLLFGDVPAYDRDPHAVNLASRDLGTRARATQAAGPSAAATPAAREARMPSHPSPAASRPG